MKRNVVDTPSKRFIIPVFCAAIFLAFAGGSFLRGQAGPAPKPGRAELEEQFNKANADRAAAREKTKERAEAAKKAMQSASDIAWIAFDAGKFEEAANWFAKSAELKEEHYAHARAYWEEDLRTAVAETEAKFRERIKESQGQMATADEAKKATNRAAIDALEKMLYMTRYNDLSMLQSIARENNDTATLLKYTEAELETRQAEMAYLERSGAPKQEVHKKTVEIATAMERIAGAQAGMALFDKAEKNYLEALALRRALPEEMAERKVEDSLSALGAMYLHKIGDLGKARDYYEQALAATEASAALRQKALGQDNWTEEQKVKMSAEELARHKESLALNQEATFATDCLSTAMALDALGGVIQEGGDLEAALSYYERALKLGDSLPKAGQINILVRATIRARVLSDMASLHAESGEVELALKELNEAIVNKRGLAQNESAAQSLLQLASLSYERGDLESARRNVEQARQIFVGSHRLLSVVFATNSLAVIARDEGKLDEAAARAEEALLLARKTGNLGAVNSTARIFASIRLKQNKLSEARTLIEEARTADAKTGSVSDRIATLGIEGEIFEAAGNNEKALGAYQEAVKLVESVRATAASEAAFADVKRNYRPYERIVRILIKMNRPEDAFDYLNRAKSRKLQDSLRLSSLKSEDKAVQSLLEKASSAENKLNTANAQRESEQAKPKDQQDKVKLENLSRVVATTQAECFRLNEQIKASNPHFEKVMTLKPEYLRKAQKQIPPEVILVQYAPLGEEIYVFLVTRTSMKIAVTAGMPADLFGRILDLRKQIKRGGIGGPLTKTLTGLYDTLIAPIEADIAPFKVIAFVPNGLLYYLPMQALAKKNAAGEVRYFIEDKQIVYLSGSDVMGATQPPDEGKSREGMTAFGNPTGAKLPGAEEEVKGIAQVFPATEVLFGSDVTKKAVGTQEKLNKRIVHFATHGILEPTKPFDSYLQLAAADSVELSRLTLGEIAGLPFDKVELVTLSACESAIGDKEPDGGEVTTLATAFSNAGAATVLASLWSVGDESTKEFMVEFYRQLAAGQSKAAALQKAQLALMKNPKYAAPLYWAPFVLMGDWR